MNANYRASLIALLIIVLSGAMPAWSSTDELQALKDVYRRPKTIPFPPDNPYTIEKAALGKALFFEARLSRDNNLSCASCHNPSFGWQVPFAKAIGAGGRPLARKSQTTINHAWSSSLFWDGRASRLEVQGRGPIEAPDEMDMPMGKAVEKLGAIEGYRQAFIRAFPGKGLTEETILQALSTFERATVSGDTPFDRWVRGDEKAISPAAMRGFIAFNGKARCATCHSGWNFTDNKFHDIGIETKDQGRFGVTGKNSDRHAMRTQGLREITARAPYMHDGSIPTLQAVIDHYVLGGVERPSRSPQMEPLKLSQEDIDDLIAFLHTLGSPNVMVPLPNLPVR